MPDLKLVYSPRPWLFLRRMLTSLIVALSLGAIAVLVSKAPVGLTVRLGAVALFLFVQAMLLGTGFLLGLPRLSIDEKGIRLRTPLRSRWADWQSLGPVDLSVAEFIYIRRPRRLVSIKITGHSVSRSLRRKRAFLIHDVYTTPIETIADTIASRSGVRVGEASIMPSLAVDQGISRRPWVTIGLLVALIGVFIGQQAVGAHYQNVALPAGLPISMVAGGTSWNQVFGAGEWYRLFTAPWLHANVTHLLSNAFCLLLGGLVLERIVGRAWMLMLFVIGGIAGATVSAALNPPALVSVGASGAIMAVFAAVLVGSLCLPPGPGRVRLQVRCGYILIASLLPAVSGHEGLRIDVAAHFGGALAGMTLMAMLMSGATNTQRLSAFQWPALAFGVAGIVVACGGMALAVERLPNQTAPQWLIPTNLVPRSEAEAVVRGRELEAHYPGDPRAHVAAATTDIRAGDYTHAAHELYVSLALLPNAANVVDSSYERRIRLYLAEVLLKEGNLPQARAEARASCAALAANSLDESSRKILNWGGFCH